MLYRARAMTKLKIHSIDGFLGDIEDLYFDDVEWRLRYLVVNTGSWLARHPVLISPEALTGYREEQGAFTTNLTRKQVEESPLAESDKPVSRQHEESLSRYYGWYPYWGSPLYPWSGVYAYAPPEAIYPPRREDAHAVDDELREAGKEGSAEAYDPNLRSFSEVSGYSLKAKGEAAGTVEDLLIEPGSWRVTHVIADTRPWWPGGEAVIDKGMVQDILWPQQEITLAMTLDEVRHAPPYDRDRGVSEDYQRAIAAYYRSLVSAGSESAAKDVQASHPG